MRLMDAFAVGLIFLFFVGVLWFEYRRQTKNTVKAIRWAQAQLDEANKRQADEMRRIAREEIAAASRERE